MLYRGVLASIQVLAWYTAIFMENFGEEETKET